MAKAKELTTRNGGDELPDYLKDAVKEDAGRGVSTAASDNIVPLIYVLHFQSPQVDETSPAYIDGARPGMIWLRNYTDGPLVSGEEGILFQPCFFHKEWVEWVPRTAGGGFVGRHNNRVATEREVKRWQGVSEGEDVPEVEDARFEVDGRSRQKIWKRMNGNELRLTRNHAGFVILSEHKALPYNIGLTGTGHAVSRNWMGSMMRKTTEEGKLLPSWAALYRLKTRQRSNQLGKWFQFDVSEAGWATPQQYKMGKQLWAAFDAGEKVVETMSEGGGEQQPAEDRQGDEIPF